MTIREDLVLEHSSLIITPSNSLCILIRKVIFLCQIDRQIPAIADCLVIF